ncbi:MAG: hypothetical protein AB9836_04475 [Aminipila sp.]
MVQIIGKPLYAKGTANIILFHPKTDDVIYSSNKMQTVQVKTSVNLGAIQGGIGNATLIQIPDTPNLTVSMTAADFSLEAQGLQVGETPHYNAIIPATESVECKNGKLSVTGVPVAPLGTSTGKITATVNGIAYEFGTGENAKTINFSEGENSKFYCVSYSVKKLQSKQVDIKTFFAPMVARALITIPLFSTENADPSTGSRAGYLYITVPRMQLNGDINVDGSQTSPTTTVLNGTGLSFDEYMSTTGDACSANEPKLAYMSVDLTDCKTYDAVSSLLVVGGGIAGKQGDTIPVPVKALMVNGATEQLPSFSEFDFTVNPATTGTMGADGVFTIGSTSGDIKMTAKSSVGRTDLKATINVEKV